MYDLSSLRPSIRAAINRAGLPERTIGLEYDDLEPYENSALEAAQKWAAMVKAGKVIKARGQKFCGKGLLLIGKPGHGKTTLASVVLQDLLTNCTPDMLKGQAQFLDYPKLLRTQQRAWKEDTDYQDFIDSLYGEAGPGKDTSIFVLDDLGKEYRTASGWAENTFDALLRARFNAGYPTIVTTNVPLKSWGEVYGEPMESFAHEAFVPIAIVSSEGDRRK